MPNANGYPTVRELYDGLQSYRRTTAKARHEAHLKEWAKAKSSGEGAELEAEVEEALADFYTDLYNAIKEGFSDYKPGADESTLAPYYEYAMPLIQYVAGVLAAERVRRMHPESTGIIRGIAEEVAEEAHKVAKELETIVDFPAFSYGIEVAFG